MGSCDVTYTMTLALSASVASNVVLVKLSFGLALAAAKAASVASFVDVRLDGDMTSSGLCMSA